MSDQIESASEGGPAGACDNGVALDITSVLRPCSLQQPAAPQHNWFSSYAFGSLKTAPEQASSKTCAAGVSVAAAPPRLQPAVTAGLSPSPSPRQPPSRVLPGLTAPSAVPSALPGNGSTGNGSRSPAAASAAPSLPGLPLRPAPAIAAEQQQQQQQQQQPPPAPSSKASVADEEDLEDSDAELNEVPIAQLPPPSAPSRLVRRDQQQLPGGAVPGSSRLPGVGSSLQLTTGWKHRTQVEAISARMRAQQAAGGPAAQGPSSSAGRAGDGRGSTVSPATIWPVGGSRGLAQLPPRPSTARRSPSPGGVQGGWVAPRQAAETLDVLLQRCEQISCTLRAALSAEKGLRPDLDGAAAAAAGGAAAGGAGATRGNLVSADLLASSLSPLASCLKPYQVVGVNFLLLLARQRVGGAILADAMGLGKTAQAVCFLGALRELEGDRRPHLVVCPASLLENWERELALWAPNLRVVTYHGPNRTPLRRGLNAWRAQVAAALASGELAAPPPGYVSPKHRAATGDSEDEGAGYSSEEGAEEAGPGGSGAAAADGSAEAVAGAAQPAGAEEEEDEDEEASGLLPALEGLSDATSGTGAFDVLLTTYTLFEREGTAQSLDRAFLGAWRWSQVVMDEAHALKNAASGRAARLRALASRAAGRLMLTGTPLQNDLGELLQLLGFLLPRVFALEETEEVLASIEGDPAARNRLVSRMTAMLAPFVLRRTKAELEGQLVNKTRVHHDVAMTPGQAALYAKALADVKAEVLGQQQQQSAAAAAGSTANGTSSSGSGRRGKRSRELELDGEVLVLEGARGQRRTRRGAGGSAAATPTTSSDSRQLAAGSSSRGAPPEVITIDDEEEGEGTASQQQQQQRQASAGADAAKGSGATPPAGEEAAVTTTGAGGAGAAATPEALAAAQSALARLGARRIGHIFSHLRKVAQHPLLVRSRYKDEDVAAIADVAVRHQLFGGKCTVSRVTQELEGYSDYELHCFVGAHPQLLGRWALPGEALGDSGKLVLLEGLLAQLQAGGHRPLIFSQWTSLLDILQPWLDARGYTYVRLDGSTPVPERQALVDTFNAPDSPVFAFLLSTRAGGQGLNLTGADTVIIHDLDFNPQVDAQAEDRCHRLGQSRPVTVHRLVLADSVDARIAAIAERKLDLDAAVLGGVTLTSAGQGEGGQGGKGRGRGAGKGKGGAAGAVGGEAAHMGEILAVLLAT